METRIVNLCDSSDENEQTICRLCSVKSDLIDLFAPKNANLPMRILILLATGIEIKQNDIVSKMVCHRCCEIAVKLHKYRTNAVANDKLLKEQSGIPYAPPIADQDELLRVASSIVNEQKDALNVNTTNKHRLPSDPLELLNLSFKKLKHDTNNKSSSDLSKTIKYRATFPNKCKRTPKIEIKHPSVQTLFKSYKNIILPEEIFKTDLSPVISLDSSEVKDWYAEQFNALKIKLKGITFKQVPRNSVPAIPSPSAVPSKDTVAASSSHDKPTVLSTSTVLSTHTADPSSQDKHTILSSSIVPSRNTATNSSSPDKHTTLSSPIVPPRYTATISSSPDKHTTVSSSVVQSKYTAATSASRRKHTTLSSPTASSKCTIANSFSNDKHNSLSSPTVLSKLPVTTPSTVNAIPSKDNEAASLKPTAITPPKHSAIVSQQTLDSSEHYRRIPLSRTRNVKRNYSENVEVGDIDSDGVDVEDCVDYNYDSEEIDVSQSYTIQNASSANQGTVMPNHHVNSQIPDSRMAEAGTSVKSHKHQSARKRTGRRATTKRRRVLSKESITKEGDKEHKEDNGENSINIPSEIDLSPKCSKETVQETVYQSLLDLTDNESLPELVTGKTLEVFMCPICNKLYDTKKELIDHERTHLKCKFCRKRVRNLAQLNEHQNESCYINIVKNKPIIKLIKVDTIPSVLEQYAAAFQQLNDYEETKFLVELGDFESIDCTNESRPDIEEVVLPMPSENSFMESEDTITNTNLISANSEENSKVECISISDDSEDEVECTEVSRHKIVNKLTTTSEESPSKESLDATVDSASHDSTPLISDKAVSNPTSPPKNLLREKEMIRSLFKKHFYPSNKCENTSQTFSPSIYHIKYTKTNLIILDGMFTELSAYKISVHLESQPKISAKFNDEVSLPEPPNSLEYWAFKNPTDVQKRVFALANCGPSDKLSNKTIFLNFVSSPSTASRLLGTFSNSSESPPTMLQGFTSNVTMSVAKPTSSTTNTMPFALSSNPGPSFYAGNATPTLVPFSNTKQPPNFVQLLQQPSNAIHQGPIVPQGSASVTMNKNKDHEKRHRPEGLVHINNNVTNINKFYVIANNVQQIPTTVPNLNYETSYLNRVCGNISLPQEQSATIREIETVNQNKSVVLYNASNESTSNNRLRVKNIMELTNTEK